MKNLVEIVTKKDLIIAKVVMKDIIYLLLIHLNVENVMKDVKNAIKMKKIFRIVFVKFAKMVIKFLKEFV